jgi:hypothetical protein
MDIRHASTINIKAQLFCGTGYVTKRSLYGVYLFEYFLTYLLSTNTLSTLKSQLNTLGKDNLMFSGRQLQ